MDDERFAYFLADLWEEYLDWYTRVIGSHGDQDWAIVATDGRTLQLIHAKQYGATAVDAAIVEEDAAIREEDPEIEEVILVTTGRFTEEAWRRASDPDVVLVDIEVLLTLIEHLGAEALVTQYFDGHEATRGFEADVLGPLRGLSAITPNGMIQRLSSILPSTPNHHDLNQPK